MTFERLVRYELDGQTCYGELLETGDNGFKVKKLKGSTDDGFESSGEGAVVVKTVCLALGQTPFSSRY